MISPGAISTDGSEVGDSDVDGDIDEADGDIAHPGRQEYDDVSSCDTDTEGELTKLVIDEDRSPSKSTRASLSTSLENTTLESTAIYDGDTTLVSNGENSHNESANKTIPYMEESMSTEAKVDDTGNTAEDKEEDTDAHNSSHENLLEEIESGDISIWHCSYGKGPWTPAPSTPATPYPPTPATLALFEDGNGEDEEGGETESVLPEEISENSRKSENSTSEISSDNQVQENSAVSTASNVETNPELELLDMVTLRPSIGKQINKAPETSSDIAGSAVSNVGNKDKNKSAPDDSNRSDNEESGSLSQKLRNIQEALKHMKSEIPDLQHNSQNTETSSDYGTDSNRGTPFSDISESSSVVVVKKEPESDSEVKETAPTISSKSVSSTEERATSGKVGSTVSEEQSKTKKPTPTLKRQVSGTEKGMINFLYKLRQQNFSSSSVIAFTHIKTLTNSNTLTTAAHLDPSKFKETKLDIIQCQGCQCWFSCSQFFTHVDGDHIVSDESKSVEPWPTKQLSAEEEVIWEQFLIVKNYFVNGIEPG